MGAPNTPPMTLSAPLPLLVGQGLPPFEAITPEQVEQAIPALLSDLNESLSALEASLEQRLGTQQAAANRIRSYTLHAGDQLICTLSGIGRSQLVNKRRHGLRPEQLINGRRLDWPVE